MCGMNPFAAWFASWAPILIAGLRASNSLEPSDFPAATASVSRETLRNAHRRPRVCADHDHALLSFAGVCSSGERSSRERTTLPERRCESTSSLIPGCLAIRFHLGTLSGRSVCKRSCATSSARVISIRLKTTVCAKRPIEELERVHPVDYLRRIADAESAGGGMLDPDTWVSPGSNLAARLAVGAGIEAVSFVLEAPERRALCVTRPPGHHALAGGRHGVLHLRERRAGRRGSPRSLRAQPRADRRFRRPSWQRHAGDLSTRQTGSDFCRSTGIRFIPERGHATRPVRGLDSGTR